MKKALFFLCIALSLLSCSEDNKEEKVIYTQPQFIGEWKLISYQDSYQKWIDVTENRFIIFSAEHRCETEFSKYPSRSSWKIIYNKISCSFYNPLKESYDDYVYIIKEFDNINMTVDLWVNDSHEGQQKYIKLK